jgi:hypothetical protein
MLSILLILETVQSRNSPIDWLWFCAQKEMKCEPCTKAQCENPLVIYVNNSVWVPWLSSSWKRNFVRAILGMPWTMIFSWTNSDSFLYRECYEDLTFRAFWWQYLVNKRVVRPLGRGGRYLGPVPPFNWVLFPCPQPRSSLPHATFCAS